MVIEELLKLSTCSLVFSEELKLCLYNIIDVCSETTSLHVHSFNSLLNTSFPAYTQLQFLTEHKFPCIYIHSFNSLLNTSLHAYTQLPFLTEYKSPCIYTASIPPEIYLSIVSSLVQKCASAHDGVKFKGVVSVHQQ